MALDLDQLVASMTSAGEGLAGSVWTDIKTFAVPELKKIATQIVAIEEGMLAEPPHFTQEGAKALLDMQVRATLGVLVAMTSLTLLAIQTAINQILDAVKSLVNGAIGFPLIG